MSDWHIHTTIGQLAQLELNLNNVAHDISSTVFSALLIQAIHSVGWHHEGKQFMCSHSDGSLTMWNLRNTTKPIQITFPHGEELTSYKSIVTVTPPASGLLTGRAVWPDESSDDMGASILRPGIARQINQAYNQDTYVLLLRVRLKKLESKWKWRIKEIARPTAAGGCIITADLLRLLPWWLDAAVGSHLICCVWMSHCAQDEDW